MAHNHRMQPVGEPHLNVRNRKVVQGRSQLNNLKSMLTRQLEREWGQSGSVFSPDFESAVEARLDNYRIDRDYAQSVGEVDDNVLDTRDELADRIRNRHNY